MEELQERDIRPCSEPSEKVMIINILFLILIKRSDKRDQLKQKKGGEVTHSQKAAWPCFEHK